MVARRRGTWTTWATTGVTARGPLGALTLGYRELKAHQPNGRGAVSGSAALRFYYREAA